MDIPSYENLINPELAYRENQKKDLWKECVRRATRGEEVSVDLVPVPSYEAIKFALIQRLLQNGGAYVDAPLRYDPNKVANDKGVLGLFDDDKLEANFDTFLAAVRSGEDFLTFIICSNERFPSQEKHVKDVCAEVMVISAQLAGKYIDPSNHTEAHSFYSKGPTSISTGNPSGWNTPTPTTNNKSLTVNRGSRGFSDGSTR